MTYEDRKNNKSLHHIVDHLENGDIELALSLLKKFVDGERERRRVSDEHTNG